MFIYYLSKFFKVSNILILNFHDLNILKNEKFVCHLEVCRPYYAVTL